MALCNAVNVGDSVYVPIHGFIKKSCDYANGDKFMNTFYGSTGTVVKARMVEEGMPNHSLVHFDSIGGEQVLPHGDMTRQGPGAWAIRKR